MYMLFDPHHAALTMAQPSQITGRLSAILDDRRNRATTTHRGAIFLSLVALMALLPLAAARVGVRPPTTTASTTPPTPANDSSAETALPSTSNVVSPDSDSALQFQNIASGRVSTEQRPRTAPSGLLPAAEMAVAPKTPLEGIAWGGVKDGLQGGLRLDTDRRRFAVGESLPLTFFLRNATRRDIAFVYTANSFDDQPLIEDEKGISHQVIAVHAAGWPWAISVILKPGESIREQESEIVIGEIPDRKPTHYPYFEKPAPGVYRISQSYRYKILTPKDIRDLQGRTERKEGQVMAHSLELFSKEGKPYKGSGFLGGAFGTMYKRQSADEGVWSKKVDFEVIAGDPAHMEQKVQGIAWGEGKGGLQAGIGFAEKRSGFTLGEAMEVNVYVRNAGTKPATFSWQSAPQFEHSTLILPTMTGPKGTDSIMSGSTPIEKPIRTKTLQPGEMTQVSTSMIDVGRHVGRPSASGMSPTAMVEPGKHSLRQAVLLKPEGAADFSLELTSGPLEFEALSSVSRAAWGTPVEGLQAGLSFVSDRHQYAVGEMVKMDLYWRNASRKDISICYAEMHDYDDMPDVFNAKGERIQTSHSAPLLLVFKQNRTLKPGESLHIGTVNMVLSADTKQGKEVGIYPTLEAKPGKYRIHQYTSTQPDEKHPLTVKADGGFDFQGITPTTGELEFEVVAK